jgi:bifunctional ADP-heptose synthase (sugar kinase/adenylyltransferase)
VVKRGAAGALVAGPDGVTEVAAGLRQVRVRDRTGAGDAFAGAMIAALVGGAALTEAVVAANAAGSEAVGRLGGVGEVDVPGISTADRSVGSQFVDAVTLAAAQHAAEAAATQQAAAQTGEEADA